MHSTVVVSFWQSLSVFVAQAAIANAATLEEVQRLENALKTGIVPSEVQVCNKVSEFSSYEHCAPSIDV